MPVTLICYCDDVNMQLLEEKRQILLSTLSFQNANINLEYDALVSPKGKTAR